MKYPKVLNFKIKENIETYDNMEKNVLGMFV